MTKTLHPTQIRLIELLKKNITDPLTIRELQEELGVSSPSVIQHHIKQLEKLGYLRRNPSNPYDYQVLDSSPENKITYLNLYGLAFCGPTGSVLDGNPLDRIPIASHILGFPSMEGFMVKAKGNSMVPRINDGDLVIARKTNNTDNGKIIVCVNKGEALIKKIKKEKGDIILFSLNPSYEPFLANDDFRIEGEVKGVLTYEI